MSTAKGYIRADRCFRQIKMKTSSKKYTYKKKRKKQKEELGERNMEEKFS